jgi:hypothetical protein
MKPREKVTNERASEYDISVAFPFSSVKICKLQQNEPINGHALECGTPVNALCMYMYTI